MNEPREIQAQLNQGPTPAAVLEINMWSKRVDDLEHEHNWWLYQILPENLLRIYQIFLKFGRKMQQDYMYIAMRI